ncbi:ADP-ribosylglycohydrolase family protein [Symbioplanes lichenis]|uniref:ADP-ribosylglycohydrolase family protein n=1 Tax=Symbioplanes lichenis TaxID=1629072 RepID=UPI00273A1103|nr:ADP-ribosylglycohydrolase family protein [Actinoplanes lichenis]
MPFTLFPGTRAALAADSLIGLSVGDAVGALGGDAGAPPWRWTDDTEEACCVVNAITDGDELVLDQDRLAELLGRHFDPGRGYGRGALMTLRGIRAGTPWPIAAAAAFDGQGSAGNGGAMRAAPLGAWHADSLAHAAAQGARAAEVTHAHPEGVAGAVAVTVAAAAAAGARLSGEPVDLLGAVIAHTPDSRVRGSLSRAVRLKTAEEAAYELGNGSGALALDSVPFAVWVAAHHLGDYRTAVETCVAAGGDMDTTAAMAGGVVAAFTGAEGVPKEWLDAREPLPEWLTVQ